MVDEVECPTCGERFAVAVPAPEERPTELDYDCEVCCRPMVLRVDEEGRIEAVGIGS
ncbi:MAG: CPXCG motif-containing cysteine-rich protein [Akkermansiaceae bacterium]|nr:CPXCG motif-containing cysteine-rich protein [Akkermansiaceae bacterium]NNM28659.1 CPXCG motif-containing cysteine-rich protein [Akkermansiaceae bacterium]